MRAMTTAFSFLTRLPVATGRADGRTWGRSLMFFPMAGAALGVGVMVVGRATAEVLSPVVASALAVAVWAWMTRGLHLAGLAHTADAWNQDAPEAGSALRPVGVHGVVALALLLLGKVVLVSELLTSEAPVSLWLVPAAARAAVVPVVLLRRLPRAEGVGKEMHKNARPGGIVLAMLSTAGALWIEGLRHWPALAGAFLAAAAVGLWLRARWRGLTDDGYGAAVEVAEVSALLGLLSSLAGPY